MVCRLRNHRGERTLREIASECGVSPGLLSLLERGRYLPKDEEVRALEAAYGLPVEQWYSRAGLLAVQEDRG